MRRGGGDSQREREREHGVHLFVRLTCHFYKQVYATFHSLIIFHLFCGNPYLKLHEEDNKLSSIKIGSKIKISIIDCCTFFISSTYTSNIPNFQLLNFCYILSNPLELHKNDGFTLELTFII